MPRPWIRVGVGGVVLALGTATAAPTASGAAPAHHAPRHPRPLHSQRIVLGHSIGGIRVGESVHRARKGFDQCGTGVCFYDSDAQHYSVVIDWGAGPVLDVGISSGTRYSPLSRVRTSKGIGIGSYLRRVRKAYPHGHWYDEDDAYVVRGRGEHATIFGIEQTYTSGRFYVHSIDVKSDYVH